MNMKKIILNLVFVLFCCNVIAQKNFEKSESFTEFDGWTKLIQLKNGNTGLMEVTKDKGLTFTLFNDKRKKIISAKLPLKKINDKMKAAQVAGVYEISGDYVAFIIAAAEDSK